jgi:hypothetical protein
VTNKVYVTNFNSGNVTVITPSVDTALPLTTTVGSSAMISGLGNATPNPTPAFTFTTNSSYAPTAPTIRTVYYQIDSVSGSWTQASGSGPFTATLPAQSKGNHVLYAYAVDSLEGGATGGSSGGAAGNTPLVGSVVAYPFTVINPLAQTITFGAPPSISVGANGSVTATGGASGNAVTFASTTTSICTVSGINGSIVTGVAAGTCTIAADQAGNAFYDAAPQVTQSITIDAGSQTITFGAAPSVIVGGAGTVSATGGASGNPVIFSSNTPAVCTVSGTNGSTVTGVSAGTCTIAANQAGNANYNAAPQVTQSFNVTAAAPTTFTVTPSAGANGTISPATSVVVNSGATSTFTVTPNSGYSASVGGTCGGSLVGTTYTTNAITANCTVIASFSPLATVPDAPTIGTATAGDGQVSVSFTPPENNGGSAITGYTATCGAQNNTGAVSPIIVSGLTNGTAVTCSVIATNAIGNSVASAASNSVTPKGDQSITFGTAPTVTVGATGTVTATGGASANPVVFTSTTTGVCTVSGSTVTGVAAGTCTIAANQAGNASYNAAPQVTLSFSVGAAVVTVAKPYDLNGDGKPDLIWRHSTNGNTYFWYMNGDVLASDAFFGSVPPSWEIVGVADFNGDGKNDVVWRNTANGDLYVWYLDNGVFVSDAFLGNVPPPWKIQGIADFNGDSKPDLLWRNADSGSAFIWYMNNASFITDQLLFNIDPVWKVEAIADLNFDGKPDLIFRNTVSGLSFVWYTTSTGNVTSLTTSAFIYGIDPVWQVVQTADYNGDGKPDFVFRNSSTGLVFVWYADGTTLQGSAFITQIDPVWEIAPRP